MQGKLFREEGIYGSSLHYLLIKRKRKKKKKVNVSFCNLLEATTLAVFETEFNRWQAQQARVRSTYHGLNKACSGSCEISEHKSTDKQLLCLLMH